MSLDDMEKLARECASLAAYRATTMQHVAAAMSALIEVARKAEVHVHKGGMRNAQELSDALAYLSTVGENEDSYHWHSF